MALLPLFWQLAVNDLGDLQSWLAPDLKPLENPGVTLLVLGGNAASNSISHQEFEQVQENLQEMDGREVPFDVTHVLTHDDMILAKVTLPEEVPSASATPYLTLWASKRVRPVFAQELLSCPEMCTVSEVAPALRLLGVIRLLTQSGDPTFFEGELLKVETHPRPSRQTEPKGHATFLDEELAAAWTASLAASIRERPPGPDVCKLKAKVQAVGMPGHVYLRWGAAAADLTASDIGAILEERLQELMGCPARR